MKTTKFKQELENIKETEYFTKKIADILYSFDVNSNNNRIDDIYDEMLEAIENGRFKTLKEGVDLFVHNYRIYTAYFTEEYLYKPDLWLKVKDDKRFFLQQKREEKLKEIKNKSLFDE